MKIVVTSRGKTINKKLSKSNCYGPTIIVELPSYIEFDERYMSNKNNSSDNSSSNVQGINPGDEFKDTNLKYNLSRFEYDLYHEEDDVSEKVIRVKRVSMPNKQEKWKIMADNKVVFVVEGTKLTNKEKDFLRSVDGVNFLIKQYKNGIKSFNSLKNEIKKAIK